MWTYYLFIFVLWSRRALVVVPMNVEIRYHHLFGIPKIHNRLSPQAHNSTHMEKRIQSCTLSLKRVTGNEVDIFIIIFISCLDRLVVAYALLYYHTFSVHGRGLFCTHRITPKDTITKHIQCIKILSCSCWPDAFNNQYVLVMLQEQMVYFQDNLIISD